MIIDILQNSARYESLHPGFKVAFDCLKKLTKEDVAETGRHELDGNKLFYMVQHYNTKEVEAGKWEAHKKYIDIQFVFEGTEIMSWDSINHLPADQTYNEDGDCYVYPGPNATDAILEAGTFAILYPEDLHKPGLKYGESAPVVKIVFKVLI
ncbi:MAG: DUF386 domain-containing protein [Ruminococcaceae bacterium]|nr:DUF386 domain-containing protein [Oscillospiraceae bacterium]